MQSPEPTFSDDAGSVQILSPALSEAQSGADEDGFKAYKASELQAQFGTGTSSHTPLPSVPPTPSRQSSEVKPAPTESEDAGEEEVWEYRGQLLTRSALSLVLRQEALAVADSSGQYAGAVSYDDIRKAWIPQWAKKLTPADVAEGEIPSTNPNDFKQKKRDPYGNKIGWRNDQM